MFEAVIWVKSTHLIKSCLKPRKREYGNKRYFYLKPHLKDCFGMEFTVTKAS